MHGTFKVLPDVVVNFIRQVFALKDRHEVARQLIGVQERRENAFVSCGDGFVMHNWTGLKGVRHWLLVAVAVVARLHLRLLDCRVILICLGSRFVDEASLDGWSRLRVFRSAIKERDVWNWLWWRFLTQWHIVVVLENWLTNFKNKKASQSYHWQILQRIITMLVVWIVIRRVRYESSNAVICRCDLHFTLDRLVRLHFWRLHFRRRCRNRYFAWPHRDPINWQICWGD